MVTILLQAHTSIAAKLINSGTGRSVVRIHSTVYTQQIHTHCIYRQAVWLISDKIIIRNRLHHTASMQWHLLIHVIKTTCLLLMSFMSFTA